MASRRALRLLHTSWKVFSYTLGALFVAVVAVQCWFFAQVLWWRSFQPEQSAFMAALPPERRAWFTG